VGRTGRGVINLGWAEMRIGKQTAWRDINNYEIDPRGPDPDLRRRVNEVIALVDAEPLAELAGKNHPSELVDLPGHARRARLSHRIVRRDGPGRRRGPRGAAALRTVDP